MVFIKTMDKSRTKKVKINYQSNNDQSNICIDLSNISNLNNEWNKVRYKCLNHWQMTNLLKIVSKPT